MRTIGYIRVSTDRQEIGPDVQKKAITKRFGDDVIWVEDIGISGGTKLEDRIELLNMIDILKPGDQVAIYRLDRIARDLLNQLLIEQKIEAKGAKIISCAGEGTDNEGPEAKLFRSILGAIAEFERAMIKARTRAAMGMKRSKGEYLGGATPFGFDYQNGKLVPNLEEQNVIAGVLKDREKAVPIRTIISNLNSSGVKTKKGKQWNISQIQRIIARHAVN
jgi:site-specific DNA recombinase